MLSAIVITKNEEKNIARCLQSLEFADEIVVVDSESTDKTVQIAKEKGARVFVNAWPGYGPQKNFAAQQAQGDWLLFVDADEEVSAELVQTITKTTTQPNGHSFYWLRIVTVFLRKPLRHLYGHNLRLFKKADASWGEAAVHEQVQRTDKSSIRLGDEDTGIIIEPLLHHSHPTVSSYLTKMQHYTTLDAQEMFKTGQHRSGRRVKPRWWLPFWLGKRQFLKLYLYRKGILDGWAGLMWCVLSGYYELVMAKKYLALVKDK